MTLPDNKTGLQIAGSDPGFTVFYRYNWQGTNLEHSSEWSLSEATVYYEWRFGAQCWTVTAVMCNFLSSVNRQECFKIGLRFPAGYMPADTDGTPMAAGKLLETLVAEVSKHNFVRRGHDQYRLRENTPFQPGGVDEIVDSIRLVPVWGPYRCTIADKGEMYINVKGGDDALSKAISKIHLLKGLGNFSEINVGRFKPMENLVDMAEGELPVPEVKIVCNTKNGESKLLELQGGRIELSSADFGYDPRAYHTVKYIVDTEELMNLVHKSLPLPPQAGVNAVYDAAAGTVEVFFAPEVRKACFAIETYGIARPSYVFDKRELPDESIDLQGEDICVFLDSASDPRYLRKHLCLAKNCPGKIENIFFDGNTVEVSVSQKSSLFGSLKALCRKRVEIPTSVLLLGAAALVAAGATVGAAIIEFLKKLFS